MPIHQCSSFPLNVLHTCTTINLQKACKSSMTFSPSNHYTPSDSFLLFLSSSFAIHSPSLSHSPYLTHSLSIFSFCLLYFLQSWILDCNIKNVPYSTCQWNLIFNVVESHMSKIYISLLKSCWIVFGEEPRRRLPCHEMKPF